MDGEISPAELEAELGDGDGPLIVDIRNPGAYRRGHIPDSVNVPLSELVGEVEAVADANRVVTVCPHGQASVKAARLIAAYEGFDGRVDSLEGGLTAWNGPVEADDPDAPSDDLDGGPDAPF